MTKINEIFRLTVLVIKENPGAKQERCWIYFHPQPQGCFHFEGHQVAAQRNEMSKVKSFLMLSLEMGLPALKKKKKKTTYPGKPHGGTLASKVKEEPKFGPTLSQAGFSSRATGSGLRLQ